MFWSIVIAISQLEKVEQDKRAVGMDTHFGYSSSWSVFFPELCDFIVQTRVNSECDEFDKELCVVHENNKCPHHWDTKKGINIKKSMKSKVPSDIDEEKDVNFEIIINS